MPRIGRVWFPGLLALVVLCGCFTPPPAQSTNGNENTNGSNPQSVLKQGVYSGTVDVNVELRVNGEVVDSQSLMRLVTQEVDANGIPVASDGQAIQVGDSVSILEAGADAVIGLVTSIEEVGNQLVVNLAISGTRDGTTVSGNGATRYTASTDTEIEFLFSLDYQGQNSQGDVMRQTESQSGRLSR